MKIVATFLLILIHCAATAGQVAIKGGVFTPLYGSAKKPVKVSSFLMDVAPVTNAEFLKFVNSHPEWSKPLVSPLFAEADYLQHWASPTEFGSTAIPDGPVVNISWFAAKSYCDARGMRLPTVNEWEYVASRPIPGADVRKVILDWYSVPTPDVLPAVKSGLKNSSGVISLHGLIWEWTLDFNSAMVTGESRADGSLDKSLFCGAGSASAADKSDYAAFLRFGFRSSLKAKYAVNNLGFRCVK
jgi:formylglycine-generating enzyme required for sulfatase activity